MRKFKILRNTFIVLALILSHAMSAETSFNYARLLCAIEHKGFSAPANIAFLLGIPPYSVGIIICLVLVLVFNNKARKGEKL